MHVVELSRGDHECTSPIIMIATYCKATLVCGKKHHVCKSVERGLFEILFKRFVNCEVWKVICNHCLTNIICMNKARTLKSHFTVVN